jgi:hypothetical protein
MRTNVTFRHPAEFVGDQDDGGGVLAVRGADWFTVLLKRVPDLELDEDLCQEDWGVVYFARRRHKKFWIGLSGWDSEGTWLAHFHHGSFAWLQWINSAGENELKGRKRGRKRGHTTPVRRVGCSGDFGGWLDVGQGS